jgi:TPP-dependent pyruvate/acetoin dehydrogenase alpha subunit|tara:strand:+ start:89 stop:673 length:585 start_codon:yes stop_codon:yes gene_type:complete
MDKQFLIDFETEVKERYEAGEIKAPVHLSSNNEDQLIEIFKQVDSKDWVFSSWRNHYHALLHGIPRDTLMDLIVRGKSMSVYSDEPKFYSSSIVGGILPIALGVAMSIKMKGEDNKVWCFVGDMTFESGLFYETYKYARNFQLPLEFVVEDNNLSTNTPVDETWGGKQTVPADVFYYEYKSDFPHHGTGTWVLF